MQTTLITPAALRVSKIGLGCVTFGREIDEGAAHALLDHAYAKGVTFFDTAAAYAEGRSEAIIGRWLKSRGVGRGEVVIATKILPPYDAERMGAAVEASLERLGVEAVDLLYLHRWDATAESAAALEALDGFVRGGRVRAIGVSNHDRAQLERALQWQGSALERFSVVQNNHNLAVSDVSADFRELCATEEVAIVTYSPLGAGFLTGKHRHGVEAGSRFAVVPGHQDVYFHEQAWRRLARLEAIAKRTGYSQAHLALAWALHEPGVASVLVGGRTPAHLDQALAALAFEDRELLSELTADEAA